VVLVGLPGSGKSTVGREAARLLGAPFTDIDAVLIEQTGMAVADFFALRGEPEFRRLESAAMAWALDAPAQIIAPGGGWVAQEGNLQAASRHGVLLLYLSVAPLEAARRLAGDTSRPLLAGVDLETRMRELLAEREQWYRRAEVEVEAASTVETISGIVATKARLVGGW